MTLANLPYCRLARLAWVSLALSAVVAGPTQAQVNDAVLQEALSRFATTQGLSLGPDTRRALAAEADAAVVAVSGRHLKLGISRIAAAAPDAVIEHLERTVSRARVPSIEALLEQRLVGSGMMPQPLRKYVVLEIRVRPPDPRDYTVRINGTLYEISSTGRYMPPTRAVRVVVIKPSQRPCELTAELSREAPNQVECVFSPP